MDYVDPASLHLNIVKESGKIAASQLTPDNPLLPISAWSYSFANYAEYWLEHKQVAAKHAHKLATNSRHITEHEDH